MAAKVQVVFYSMYGHIFKMAEAVVEGARQAGADVSIYQVPETLPDDVLVKMHATEAKKAFAHIPTADVNKLPEADAIIFGTPTRYGSVCGQMQAFMDKTGQLWASGALIGKVGSVFASTASQHGGQETTIRALHTELLHHGMVLVGVPYSQPDLTNISEMAGGTPYGATTIAGPKGERMPSELELRIARFQGKHVAEIAAKMAR